MIRRAACLLCFVAAVAGTPSRAQDSKELDRPFQAFDQVIPAPTGKNGYEELVRAADLTVANKALNDLQQLPTPGATLTDIRKVLTQPDLVRARALLRLGLSKPVTTPRAFIDDETKLPEFAGFRNLARMLALQLYVDCADGRMDRAIDTLRECLRFGYVVQTDSLISGLVGIAVDMIAVRRFGNHLEQLSAGDCERLISAVREWLRLPDPAIAMLDAERRGIVNMLRKYRSDPEKLITSPSEDPDSEDSRDAAAVLAHFKSDPSGIGLIVDQAAARMDAHFGRALNEMKKPYWERSELPKVADDTPAGRLCRLLGDSSISSLVADRYARELAEVQMLAVYAAVRRFRWEYQVLPASLGVLKLGSLAVDPFTGKPFSYKVISETAFELSSVGPVDRRDDSPTSGQRTPVTVPYKRP